MATRADQVPAEGTPNPPEGGENGQDQGQTQGGQTTPDGDQGTEATGGAPPPDSGVQSPFSHASLRGRSPEDVERYVSLLENTVREQGTALNRNATPPATQQQAPPEAEVSDEQYWQNPTGVLRRMIDESLKPFREDLTQTRAVSVVEQLRNELPDYDRYAPLIDNMLTQQGITDRSNPNLLKFTYFAIRGQEATMGGGTNTPAPSNQNQQTAMNGSQSQPQQGANSPPPAPPQHRPSNSPLPQQRGGQTQKRQLTESEKRIAREMGQTDEQYLAWLEVPADEVVSSKIGVSEGGGK